MITPTHPDYELLKEFYNNHIGEVSMPFENTEEWQKERLMESWLFEWFKLRRAGRGLISDILNTFKKLQHGK